MAFLKFHLRIEMKSISTDFIMYAKILCVLITRYNGFPVLLFITDY